MNLRHLSVFHGVAKAGSVNSAARLLHTSQPAVSRELRILEGRLRDEAIEAKEFRRDRIVAVVAPEHSLAKAKGLSVRSLAESASILREPGSGTREIVERAFSRHRLVLRCGLQISNSEALK